MSKAQGVCVSSSPTALGSLQRGTWEQKEKKTADNTFT